MNTITADYKLWLTQLKGKIRSTQIKASIAVNSTLIEFYWDLGKMINEKQTAWGSKFIEQLSKDLKAEFPDMEGFSRSNLFNTIKFYQFYNKEIVQQLVGLSSQDTEVQLQKIQQPVGLLMLHVVSQIPWGHNILIFSKSKDVIEAKFYIQQTISNGWSRETLTNQIKSNLYQRQGKAITNFKSTLPDASSDLAHQLLKDPYQFDFLTLTQNYKERELESALVDNITKFLLELGSGFAYVGKQVPIIVGDKEFFIDLLFYHLKLRAYVVVELKTTDFIPEYAGKLSFYLSATNNLLRHPADNPTIGLMICKNKNNIIAEYALNNIIQPIGVTEYELTKLFPDEYKSSLPTIEEIEEQFKDY